MQANGGRVLGFSLSGAVIPAGSGTLVFLDISFTGDSGTIEFDAVQFSDPDANPYVVNAGPGIVVEDVVEPTMPHYNVDLVETGEYQLVIFQETISS